METFPEKQGGMGHGGLCIEIDAVGANGAYRNELPLSVGTILPDGTSKTVEARQTVPGRTTATIATPETATTWITVHSPAFPEGGPTLGHTPSYPADFLNNGTDRGRPGKTLFAPPEKGIRQHTNLAPAFLAAALLRPTPSSSPPRSSAALLFFPLDIWLRRRS